MSGEVNCPRSCMFQGADPACKSSGDDSKSVLSIPRICLPYQLRGRVNSPHCCLQACPYRPPEALLRMTSISELQTMGMPKVGLRIRKQPQILLTTRHVPRVGPKGHQTCTNLLPAPPPPSLQAFERKWGAPRRLSQSSAGLLISAQDRKSVV